MSIFDVNVIGRIREFVPLDDISIRVLHLNHPMQPAKDECIFTIPIGTTLGKIKQKLVDAKFKRLGWLDDEMLLWEKMRPCVELTDNGDFEDDTTLHLNLVNKHYSKEESEEEVSEEEVSEEESEEDCSS